MKVTFIEEIESRKAWHQKMFCPKCDDYHYEIHHQTFPETPTCWWLTCKNCGFESYASPTREIAIARWKQQHADSL